LESINTCLNKNRPENLSEPEPDCSAMATPRTEWGQPVRTPPGVLHWVAWGRCSPPIGKGRGRAQLRQREKANYFAPTFEAKPPPSKVRVNPPPNLRSPTGAQASRLPG